MASGDVVKGYKPIAISIAVIAQQSGWINRQRAAFLHAVGISPGDRRAVRHLDAHRGELAEQNAIADAIGEAVAAHKTLIGRIREAAVAQHHKRTVAGRNVVIGLDRIAIGVAVVGQQARSGDQERLAMVDCVAVFCGNRSAFRHRDRHCGEVAELGAIKEAIGKAVRARETIIGRVEEAAIDQPRQ